MDYLALGGNIHNFLFLFVLGSQYEEFFDFRNHIDRANKADFCSDDEDSKRLFFQIVLMYNLLWVSYPHHTISIANVKWKMVGRLGLEPRTKA